MILELDPNAREDLRYWVKQDRRKAERICPVTNDQETALAEDRIPPVHPGEVLLEDFLKPMGISQYRLARALNVPPQRIGAIVHGRRAVTADTALRLGRFFNMEPPFWLNLQARYDLEMAADALEGRLEREVEPYVA